MPLQISFTDERNGVPFINSYVEVLDFSIDTVTRIAVYKFAIYKDKAAKDNRLGRVPDYLELVISDTDFDQYLSENSLSAEGMNPVKAGEEFLMTLDAENNSTDRNLVKNYPLNFKNNATIVNNSQF